jgi:RimJ/RimL family protein N-acetyltransferase
MLDAAIDAGGAWTMFPDALRATRDAVAADPDSARWGVRLFLLEDSGTVVGWGGFKGPPRDGVVELGYEIADRWSGRGLATEAVRAMVREAFAAAEVRAVVAHTMVGPGASVRVLEKAGFVNEGEVPDEGVGRAWRFRLERPGRPDRLTPAAVPPPGTPTRTRRP